MVKLFTTVAKEYADSRPSYPPELFEYVASKTPDHDVVWDVGTGNGQAARSLATHYTTVIATDTSQKQLDLAEKLPNISYRHTPPTMSIAEVEEIVAPSSTVDLVTVAQALHWFDLPSFYKNVQWVLKKPHGVIAAWCYAFPEVNSTTDAVLDRINREEFAPYWKPTRRLVEEGYRTIDFPFEEVDGEEPAMEFVAEKEMEFEDYLTYVRSMTAYQRAKDSGVEILSDEVIEEFETAWNEDGEEGKKVAKFPIHLRIGKVGDNYSSELDI